MSGAITGARILAKTNQKGESACSPPPMLLLTPHGDMSSAPGVGGHHRSHLYILPDVLWIRFTMVSKDMEGTEAGESPREEQRQTRSPNEEQRKTWVPVSNRNRPGAGVFVWGKVCLKFSMFLP